MTDASGLSLREAARETGVAKSTILRAIKAGRLSAARTDDGGYAIQPVELFRVYDPATVHGPADGPERNGEATAALEAQLVGLRDVAELLRSQLAETRQDRDHWRTQAEAITRQLEHQPAPKRSWWRRLAG